MIVENTLPQQLTTDSTHTQRQLTCPSGNANNMIVIMFCLLLPFVLVCGRTKGIGRNGRGNAGAEKVLVAYAQPSQPLPPLPTTKKMNYPSGRAPVVVVGRRVLTSLPSRTKKQMCGLSASPPPPPSRTGANDNCPFGSAPAVVERREHHPSNPPPPRKSLLSALPFHLRC